jgi:hypothetical protein
MKENDMAYNNGNSYDQEAEYAKKSTVELIAIRTQFELAVINHPNGPKMFNEHLEWVKMKIAERIGRK